MNVIFSCIHQTWAVRPMRISQLHTANLLQGISVLQGIFSSAPIKIKFYLESQVGDTFKAQQISF